MLRNVLLSRCFTEREEAPVLRRHLSGVIKKDKFARYHQADINKAFVAKRKCLETFTSSSLKTSQQKIEEVWKSQQNEAQMSEDYGTQFSSVFQQWESDIQRTKDQDKKLMSLFQHQKSMFQQMRASRGQRLKMLRQLMDHYIKSMQELEVTHEEQNTAVMSELRQEMALLQKKILMNTVSPRQTDFSSIPTLFTPAPCFRVLPLVPELQGSG
uniref:XLR/SYCP3/FAM9 domain-containing protein n=1 Tax=Pygocentrus nattereri TaxID=42514 RepID=A0A3B4CFB5_PYGNA